MKKNFIFISIIVLLAFAIIGVSYAYFASVIHGNESSTTINANSAEISVTFSDGSGYINATNIIPSSVPFATKNFTVSTINTIGPKISYLIVIVVDNNTFSNGAISYMLNRTNQSMHSLNTGTGSQIVLDRVEIQANSTEQFEINFYYLDNGTDQSFDMNKTFEAHIEVGEL